MQRKKKSVLERIDFSNVPENFAEKLDKLESMYLLYNCAIREVNTKLKNLNQEMEFVKERNPIQNISYRLKKPESIIEKLERYGLEVNGDNVWNKITDVAALRVVCSYIDDIYDIVDMLVNQDDIVLLEKKDYIRNPKESGYRSMHLIIEVPVFLSDEKKMVKVEIQIRTIAMDFWASLEHQLRYKTEAEIPDRIKEKLKQSAENVYGLDMEMQEIYKAIEKLETDGEQ